MHARTTLNSPSVCHIGLQVALLAHLSPYKLDRPVGQEVEKILPESSRQPFSPCVLVKYQVLYSALARVRLSLCVL